MRPHPLPFLFLLPTLLLAAPPTPPKITALTFSGTGCPSSSSGSVTPDSTLLSDTASFSFTQLHGSSTDNCALHIQSTGATPGWQVAVQEVEYKGDVALSGKSSLDTITQVFWSERAGDTATLTSTLPNPSPNTPNPPLTTAVTLRSSTSDLVFSKCTSSDGNPGILNVNFRPVVQGVGGSYVFKRGRWGLVWRAC
ncbi:hypothetical protein NX059_000313 [Plenodomus lindquistii]|nr:hypothetical protein NX059_000313 [Plenodomus lindquistii]